MSVAVVSPSSSVVPSKFTGSGVYDWREAASGTFLERVRCRLSAKRWIHTLLQEIREIFDHHGQFASLAKSGHTHYLACGQACLRLRKGNRRRHPSYS